MGVLTKLARIWLTKSFKPFHFTDENDDYLMIQNVSNLGLYVHIPFCRTICEFCPYCKTVYNKEIAAKYVEALLKEIELVGRMSNGEIIKITTLYFGGGSPALVADSIKRIIEKLKKYFDITQGIGIELHPSDVNEETLLILKHAGITKISIGVQSFQDKYLGILGRDEVDYEKMFDAISKVPFETVSMDFIFALPNQTIDILKKDIDLAFSHGANHVAVYPFIDFSFTHNNIPSMKESEKKALLYQLVDYCEGKGYTRDSIWTFSNSETAGYSSMTREMFLGFGCSATTLLKDQFKINTFDVHKYIEYAENQRLPSSLSIKFSVRQRMVYYLFWSIYSMKTSRKDYYDFFNSEIEDDFKIEILLARIMGWVHKRGDSYIMTTKGSYYYHYFENYYTLSYIDKMWNLMRSTAFPKELIIG